MFGCWARGAFAAFICSLGISFLAVACEIRGCDLLLTALCVLGFITPPLTKAATGLSPPGIKDYMVYEKIIITKKHEDLNA